MVTQGVTLGSTYQVSVLFDLLRKMQFSKLAVFWIPEIQLKFKYYLCRFFPFSQLYNPLLNNSLFFCKTFPFVPFF